MTPLSNDKVAVSVDQRRLVGKRITSLLFKRSSTSGEWMVGFKILPDNETIWIDGYITTLPPDPNGPPLLEADAKYICMIQSKPIDCKWNIPYQDIVRHALGAHIAAYNVLYDRSSKCMKVRGTVVKMTTGLLMIWTGDKSGHFVPTLLWS